MSFHRFFRWSMLLLCALSVLTVVAQVSDDSAIHWYKMPPSPPPPGFHGVRGTYIQQPGDVLLDNIGGFSWVYGCSPTAAGIMMSYYDRHGYPNLYTGPANGGVCPLTNDPVWGEGECPFIASHLGIDGRLTRGHVDDYWGEPDPYIAGGWTPHTDDSIADFMGTNEGMTQFWTGSSGKPGSHPQGSQARSMNNGPRLYAEFCGYSAPDSYAQAIYNTTSAPYGMTFAQYCAEIDAGHPVLMMLSSSEYGHTIIGVGYNPAGNTVYAYNTWGNYIDTLTWGGILPRTDMRHWAVLVAHLGWSTPQHVSASKGTSATAITITWDPVTPPAGGQVYYRVYYGTKDDGSDRVAVSGWQLDTSVIDSTHIRGYYWVTAATSATGAQESAFSSVDCGWVTRTTRIIRVSPTGNDANDGSSWALAMRTISAAISASSDSEIWVQQGKYRGYFTLPAFVALYGGFNGTETTRETRNWAVNRTIIEGWCQITNTWSYPVVIDGFTICHSNSGGLLIYYSSPIISHNMIGENSSSGSGGGILCNNSNAVITQNVIYGNSSKYGGGLHLYIGQPSIINNTFVNNYAQLEGGAICIMNGEPIIANNIVTLNSSGIYDLNSDFFDLDIHQNCLADNLKYDINKMPVRGRNYMTSPRLIDPAHANWHLQPDSPCRDAGDDSFLLPGALDAGAQARIYGSHVDLGAYETDGTAWPSLSPKILHVSTSGNDNNDGVTWASAKRTISSAIDAATPGSEVWVKAGTYTNAINLYPYIALYGGFAGTETVRDERDWNVNPTIIDGKTLYQSMIFAEYGGYDSGSIVDGFIFQNSANTSIGSVLRCKGMDITISHNIFRGNQGSSGGGIYGTVCKLNILDNIFASNNVTDSGGAICLDTVNATIANNTLVGNTATVAGGAVSLKGTGDVTVANNIVLNNSSGIVADTKVKLVNDHNCLFNNTLYDLSGVTAGAGTILADPLLVNAAGGNYHLSSTSPCINAGNTTARVTSGWDIDKQVRLIGSAIEIGADEVPQVVNPVITPPSGTYVKSVLSSITCDNPDAWIHYTLDGSEPTEASPIYFLPTKITSDKTVKAKAFMDGMAPSDTASASYTIIAGIYQPDLQIRPYFDLQFRGDNIYIDDPVQTCAATVEPGDSSTYMVRIENDGNTDDIFTLTATAIPEGWNVVYRDSADRNRTPYVTGYFGGGDTISLQAGASVEWSVEITPTTAARGTRCAATFTAISENDPNRHDDVTMSLTVRQNAKPDLQLRTKAETAYSGDNLYSSDGANQQKRQDVANGVYATYYIAVQNDGGGNDSFVLKAPATPAGWKATYYNGTTWADLTTAITSANGWTTGPLAVGGLQSVYIAVSPTTTAAGGSTFTQTITAASTADGTQSDTVQLLTGVTVRRGTDLLLRTKTETPMSGDNLYSSDGANQVKRQNVNTGAYAIYYVNVQNDGNAPDSYTLKAAAPPAGWRLTVYDTTTWADITTALTGSNGWASGNLAGGAQQSLYVALSPGNTVANAASATLAITAVSQADATKTDAVQLITTVVQQNAADLLLRTKTETVLSGDNVYGNDGVNQMKTQSVANGVYALYYVAVQNDGLVSDTFTVKAPAVPKGWKVIAYNTKTWADITAALTGTTGWTSDTLASGASQELYLAIMPDGTAYGGSSYALTLQAVSQGNTAKLDTVTLKTSVVTRVGTDMLVRLKSETAYGGSDVYGDGSTQQRAMTVPVGTFATYYATVQNDGNAPDRFTVKAPATPAGWKVYYYDGLTWADITATITSAGGWQSTSLAPGGYHPVYVAVQPTAAVAGGVPCTLTLTGTSQADPTKTDAVQLRTTRPLTVGVDLLLRTKAETVYSGDNLYSTDGTTQQKSQTVAHGVYAVYYVTVQNEGNAPDTVTLTMSALPAGWSVYGANGATDITSQLASGLTISNLAPGAVLPIYLAVKSTAPTATPCTLTFTATSGNDPTKTDVARVVTALP